MIGRPIFDRRNICRDRGRFCWRHGCQYRGHYSKRSRDVSLRRRSKHRRDRTNKCRRRNSTRCTYHTARWNQRWVTGGYWRRFDRKAYWERKWGRSSSSQRRRFHYWRRSRKWKCWGRAWRDSSGTKCRRNSRGQYRRRRNKCRRFQHRGNS